MPGEDSTAPDAAPAPDQPLVRVRRYGAILNDFGRMAAEVTETEALLQLACVQAARGTGIGHTKVMRHRPENGDLLIVAGTGWHPGVVGHVSVGTDLASPPGQALQTRQPVITHDLPNDPEFRHSRVLREHGIVASLNAPIVLSGVVWGVLEVDSETPQRFGPDDVNFLSTLASLLGLAIHVHQGQEAAAGVIAQERMLFNELQHRNKNDLQLILALLVMQRRRLPDAEGRRIFGHVLERVAAIGVAHDQLTFRHGAGIIQLADYLRALCGNLSQRREGVTILTDLVPAELPHARAVPLGLAVNELVTNALKHAFPEGREGTIRLAFRALEGEGELTVRDDGIGMGPPRPGSAGTDLVRRLVQQVGGRVERTEEASGTGFRILFPLAT